MATAFERFFEGEFQTRLLRPIAEPGLLSSGLEPSTMSWDRRAAYLLWVELGRPSGPVAAKPPAPAEETLEDLFG